MSPFFSTAATQPPIHDKHPSIRRISVEWSNRTREEWAEQQFGGCALGDPRRVSRLVTVAAQMAARPDGSTPTQTESRADCQGACRLFNNPAVSFDAIIAPHCALTRACGRAGDVMLILNDTTEVNYGSRDVEGLGRVGDAWGGAA